MRFIKNNSYFCNGTKINKKKWIALIVIQKVAGQ